jgi:predicted dithiol-disulfide oxidoreductase (DUF899 family)
MKNSHRSMVLTERLASRQSTALDTLRRLLVWARIEGRERFEQRGDQRPLKHFQKCCLSMGKALRATIKSMLSAS